MAAAKAAASTTVQDYWEQTNRNININTAGGVETPIMTLTLPAGKWVLHADQTMAARGRDRPSAVWQASVDHFHVEAVIAVPDPDCRGDRAGVAQDVGQRFLDDPVGRQVDRRGQRTLMALDDGFDRKARLAHLVDELVEVADTRRR